jgi:hypothetical protein
VLVAELDEVTYDLEVDGEPVRRTLQRRVWERRGWATVALVFEERDAAGAWKPAKLALIRLQRVRGAWKKHAAITLAGPDALALGDAIAGWRVELHPGPFVDE